MDCMTLAVGTSCNAIAWQNASQPLPNNKTAAWVQKMDMPVFELTESLTRLAGSTFFQKGAKYRALPDLRARANAESSRMLRPRKDNWWGFSVL